MALSDDDVRKLALLARLELSDQEVASIGPQLESILGFVEQLAELDTDSIEPMTTALDVDNPWREDVIVPSLDHGAALSAAAASDDNFFLVPPVLGTAATGSDGPKTKPSGRR